MGFVGNLVLYAAVKKNFAHRSRIDKVIAMVRMAAFFDSRCNYESKSESKLKLFYISAYEH